MFTMHQVICKDLCKHFILLYVKTIRRAVGIPLCRLRLRESDDFPEVVWLGHRGVEGWLDRLASTDLILGPVPAHQPHQSHVIKDISSHDTYEVGILCAGVK